MTVRFLLKLYDELEKDWATTQYFEYFERENY